jgi:hypothetical protein
MLTIFNSAIFTSFNVFFLILLVTTYGLLSNTYIYPTIFAVGTLDKIDGHFDKKIKKIEVFLYIKISPFWITLATFVV